MFKYLAKDVVAQSFQRPAVTRVPLVSLMTDALAVRM